MLTRAHYPSDACPHARDDARRDALNFPDEDSVRDFSDYRYVAQQVLTTFATSDVTVVSREARRLVTKISTAAMIFNTVAIALLVSGILVFSG